MTVPTTETTQALPVTTTIPPVTTEQGTVGATTPAPSKTSEGQTTIPATQPPVTLAVTTPAKPTPEEAQKRINRMYARLQEERKQRLAAETLANATPRVPVTRDEDAEDEEPTTPTLTEADVEAVLARKEREQHFVASEVRVFEQHADALNEDGSFNMSSPFVQKYIEIGRRNPMLAMMENGPEMAAAMVDKELGSDFKKGRVAEATRLGTQAVNTFTTSSTTAIPPNVSTTQLTDVQKKVAKRMGVSEAEYIANQGSNQVKQKSWEVKAR